MHKVYQEAWQAIENAYDIVRELTGDCDDVDTQLISALDDLDNAEVTLEHLDADRGEGSLLTPTPYLRDGITGDSSPTMPLELAGRRPPHAIPQPPLMPELTAAPSSLAPTVLTAMVGRNAILFARLAALYVSGLVLDMTYGKGGFWQESQLRIGHDIRLVKMDALLPADVKADFRQCPFRPGAFDAVILDPPYAQHGGGSRIKASIAGVYQLGAQDGLTPTSAEEVLELYRRGMAEAMGLLHRDGCLVIKCQDQIESGKQVWIHVLLLQMANLIGFDAEDLFILVQPTEPARRWDYQRHARKNHSYFLVFRKNRGRHGRAL